MHMYEAADWLLLLWQTSGDAEAVRFGIVTLLLPLLLMSNLLFTVGFVVAERTLYIPRLVVHVSTSSPFHFVSSQICFALARSGKRI